MTNIAQDMNERPPLSVLDLCKREGRDAGAALEDTLRLAETADAGGYRRMWVAEHHVDDASHACPEVLVALLATRTQRIRIGSGGVLLRYYSPLKVAETFLMLEAIAPGRIDLGIAKGPGVVDARVAEALVSENLWELHPNAFERKAYDLSQLLRARPEASGDSGVRPQPTGVEPPPLWILGSGPGSSGLAARLRRPYALALFFAGAGVDAGHALAAYRDSVGESQPPTIVAVSVTCAETPAAARRRDAEFVEHGKLGANLVGTPDACAQRLGELRAYSGADEVMVTTFAGDSAERRWVIEALAEAWTEAPASVPGA